MTNLTILEADTLEEFHKEFGYVEFTRKVLLRCKDKRNHGLAGVIKIVDAEYSKRIFLENEDGKEFTIRYFIDQANQGIWSATYALYFHCPDTGSGVMISEGFARAKYCWQNDSKEL